MFYIKKSTSKKAHKKGFTLLETLIAVFILTLALTGPIYIASLAIRGSVESRDNVTAYHLAEEAIEVIRNNRDTISLQSSISSTNWLTGITGGSVLCTNTKLSTNVLCYMTRDSAGAYTFAQCPTAGCPALTFDPIGPIVYGRSDLSSVGISKFTREIYIKTAPLDTSGTVNADREAEVVVTMRWTDRGRTKQFVLVERLHNQEYAKYYVQ